MLYVFGEMLFTSFYIILHITDFTLQWRTITTNVRFRDKTNTREKEYSSQLKISTSEEKKSISIDPLFYLPP